MISDKLYKIFSISKDIGYKKVRSSGRIAICQKWESEIM